MEKEALETDLTAIEDQVRQAVRGLLEVARLEAGEILVVGCSTSEILGKRVGSAGSTQVAASVFRALDEETRAAGIRLAVQCCEHLNRALVVERDTMRAYGLERVSVRPVPKAGGALAAMAMERFGDSVVVESIQAHAGLDIGSVLIGMHLKPVAVPVRLSIDRIGEARLTMARTRPRLIGGQRAVYSEETITKTT
ncbi:MAG: TIGR01440 family protein [Bacillota bacterium]